ncbi:uncharacterized protein LOC133304318 [Gastrolobium bilobum]|uniref:uncharacterized protein LOC133304318 n=1 Tax=Gastrolobium bilobum TaxID=150636 RepID=UPI002AB1ED6F|nr:uncharacterized protein LOC133304318 [Gastrolobium bilobum]
MDRSAMKSNTQIDDKMTEKGKTAMCSMQRVIAGRKGITNTSKNIEKESSMEGTSHHENNHMDAAKFMRRGANKRGFTLFIKYMCKKYKIKILILTEVRISGVQADRKIKNIGFDGYLKQDVVGFSGGIWVLWDNIEVEKVAIFVYGSPRRIARRLLWEELFNLSLGVNKPWLVMGDFNAICNPFEKKGGNAACLGSMREFNECLSKCNISDIDFKGPSFTWKRGQLLERLDKVAINAEWMENVQERDVSWKVASHHFQEEAEVWHKQVFRENIRRKFRLHARIVGIDEELRNYPSESLEILQRNLWEELNKIYSQEELFWFQRSRSQWLVGGDRNTKFYHASTVGRQRHNIILTLKDKSDN